MNPNQTKAMTITGWVITGIASAMLTMGVVGMLMKGEDVMKNMVEKGPYAESSITGIAIAKLCCVILLLIPRTAVLGAPFTTAYLGGAVATHVITGDTVLFPALFGVAVWIGLWLRCPGLRALFPVCVRTDKS